jgi:hypothetical protein
MMAGSRPACPLTAGYWCKPVLPCAKKPSVLSDYSIARLWDGGIFRGCPPACTKSPPWMNSFDAEAYGEELEVLGPLKVGRGYRFSFSYSVTDIEILADLTTQQSRTRSGLRQE